MADNQVNKDVCKEKHVSVNEKLVGLKANIHTSKESLSNRLDEVSAALLGDRTSPGGLLRDIVEVKKDVERTKTNINEKIKSQNTKITLCIGLIVILIGGRFFGVSFDTIKKYFKPHSPTPITAPAPIEEENDKIPKEIRDYIKERLNNTEESE